jgi:hypothetical protein
LISHRKIATTPSKPCQEKNAPFVKYFFVVILGGYTWRPSANRPGDTPGWQTERVIKFTNTHFIIYNKISQLRYDRELLGTQAFMEYRLDKKALAISGGGAVIFTTGQS